MDEVESDRCWPFLVSTRGVVSLAFPLSGMVMEENAEFVSYCEDLTASGTKVVVWCLVVGVKSERLRLETRDSISRD